MRLYAVYAIINEVQERSIAYNLGYGIGYVVARYWPLIILCVIALAWMYWRKKRNKKS